VRHGCGCGHSVATFLGMDCEWSVQGSLLLDVLFSNECLNKKGSAIGFHFGCRISVLVCRQRNGGNFAIGMRKKGILQTRPQLKCHAGDTAKNNAKYLLKKPPALCARIVAKLFDTY
jgi:hypothetical protein